MHGHLKVKIIHIRHCNIEAFTAIRMKLYTSRERTALSFKFHKNSLSCNKEWRFSQAHISTANFRIPH